MKFREDKWLEEKVQGWVEEKIISSHQAEAILAKTKKETRSPILKATGLLTALGGLCVALGVILVVSHNWDEIPSLVKILVFLLLLALTAEGYRRTPGGKKIAGTALLILWLMLPLAGIGLWAQIFLLSGDPLKPLLFWLALGLPLVWATGNRAVCFVHTAGLVIAAYTGAFNHGTWFSLTDPGFSWWEENWEGNFLRFATDFGLPFLLLGAFWAFIIKQTRKLLGNNARLLILLSLSVFLWALFFTPTPFFVFGVFQFAVVGAALALFWGLRDVFRLEPRPWEGWGIFLAFACLYSITFLWHGHSGYDRAGTFAMVSSIVLLLAGALFVWLMDLSKTASSPGMARVLKFLILSPGLLGLLLLADTPPKAVAAMANLAFLGFAVWMIREGVMMNRPKKINWAVLFIGLLIFTRFLDYFGTMLQSGLAFIVAGLFLVGAAWVLNKGRQKLLVAAGRGRP